MTRLRRALSWAGQTLPPLLVLGLFGLPFDVLAAPFWLAGAIAALASAGSLMRLAVRRWRDAGHHERVEGGAPSRAIRPAMTLVLFAAAAAYAVSLSARLTAEADALGRTAARASQAACAAAGRCPEAPPGWEARDGRVCRSAGYMRACYTLAADGRGFTIRVRHRGDDALFLTGGVDRVLAERHECC